MFDPFWARVEEARVVVAPHAGFDDGYRGVDDAVACAWGYGASNRDGDTDTFTVTEPFVQMLMKHRIVHDFAAALVAHQLFERFPALRIAYIENGGTWVPNLLHGLHLLAGQHPEMFKSSPVDQFIEHCWVAPFVEDSVEELAHHLPVDRILFGSDWPHAEGLRHPRDFFDERRVVLRLGPAPDHGRERARTDAALTALTRRARADGIRNVRAPRSALALEMSTTRVRIERVEATGGTDRSVRIDHRGQLLR